MYIRNDNYDRYLDPPDDPPPPEDFAWYCDDCEHYFDFVGWDFIHQEDGCPFCTLEDIEDEIKELRAQGHDDWADDLEWYVVENWGKSKNVEYLW